MTPSELVGGGYVTVPEIAEYLRISRTTVYALMASGDLPYIRIGRCRRISKRALEQLELALATRGGSA